MKSFMPLGKSFLPVLVKVAENIVMTNEMHFFVSEYCPKAHSKHRRSSGARHSVANRPVWEGRAELWECRCFLQVSAACWSALFQL